MSSPNLFQPIQVGTIKPAHRVVMAPMTRFRATDGFVPSDIMVEQYAQRASTPGTLLITEATAIVMKAGGYPNIPALETDEQLAGWKKVTDAVHSKGSFIYSQLWALGRAAVPDFLKAFGWDYVSSSDILYQGQHKPRPLTVEEIKEYVSFYGTAAANAMTKGGFDGVEIHGGNGYLIDQFTKPAPNNRTDEYGGSVENRCRFALEVVESVVKAVGDERKVGIRFTPWDEFQEMGNDDPKPTFSYLAKTIKERYPNFGYIHAVEPRIRGNLEYGSVPHECAVGENNDFLREVWSPKTYISCGGYNRDIALQVSAKHDNELIAFARWFLSNPDLPVRLKDDLPLNEYNRHTFYLMGPTQTTGYTDYPFANASQTEKKEAEES